MRRRDPDPEKHIPAASNPRRASFPTALSFGLASFLSSAGLSVASSIVIGRLYGVQVVGEFALAYAPTAAVNILSTLREQPALIRRVAVLEPRAPAITGLFLAVSTFSAALTVVACGVGVAGAYLAFNGPLQHPNLFWPAVLSLGGYLLLTNPCWNMDSVFVAFRAGRQLFWLRLHQYLAALVIVIVAASVSRSVWSLILGNALAYLTPLVHRLVLIRRWMRFRVSWATVTEGFRTLPEMLRWGVKMVPGAFAQGASEEAPTWILGGVVGIASVGAFNRAWTIGRRFLDLNFRVSEMLFPTLVQRREAGDRTGFDRALIDTLRYVTFVMLLPAAILGGAARVVMGVFGPGFEVGASALAILVIVPWITGLVSGLQQSLIAMDRPFRSGVAHLVRFAVTVPATIVLANLAGVTGAAAGLLMGSLAQLATQAWLTRAHVAPVLLGMWPARQMFASAGAFAAGFGCAYAVQSLGTQPFLLLAVLPSASAAYVAAFVLLGGLLPRDRRRLSSVRSRLAGGKPTGDAMVTTQGASESV